MSFLPSALEEAHRMSRESSPVYYRDGTPTRLTNLSDLYFEVYNHDIYCPFEMLITLHNHVF